MNTAPTKNYLIHVYEDKECLKYLCGIPNQAKNRKEAVRIMKNEMAKDLTAGNYFFYVVTEQTMKVIDFAPNTDTTN
jgi:hypothetical protein